MNFECFLFDLDNCLVHYPNFKKFIDINLVKTLKDFMDKIPNKIKRNKIWKPRSNYNNLLKKWGIIDLDCFWKAYENNGFIYRKKLINSGDIYLYPDVIDVLTILQENNKKLALVSNSPKHIVEYFVKKFRLSSYFLEIYGIDYAKEPDKAKPSPQGIELILDKMEFNPKNYHAIMIGDSVVDIIAAKKAGINACIIKRDLKKYSDGYKKWKFQPDYVIYQLNEILAI